MSVVEQVLRHVRAGRKIRISQDYYGRQWVTMQGRWLFWRRRKLLLRNEDAARLRAELSRTPTVRIAA